MIKSHNLDLNWETKNANSTRVNVKLFLFLCRLQHSFGLYNTVSRHSVSKLSKMHCFYSFIAIEYGGRINYRFMNKLSIPQK